MKLGWLLLIALLTLPVAQIFGKSDAKNRDDLVRRIERLEKENEEIRRKLEKRSPQSEDSYIRIQMENEAPVEFKGRGNPEKSPSRSADSDGGSVMQSLKGLKDAGFEKIQDLQEYLKKLQHQHKEMEELIKEIDGGP